MALGRRRMNAPVAAANSGSGNSEASRSRASRHSSRSMESSITRSSSSPQRMRPPTLWRVERPPQRGSLGCSAAHSLASALARGARLGRPLRAQRHLQCSRPRRASPSGRYCCTRQSPRRRRSPRSHRPRRAPPRRKSPRPPGTIAATARRAPGESAQRVPRARLASRLGVGAAFCQSTSWSSPWSR